MKIELSLRADSEIERALKWWQENRPDAPAMLADELGEYFDKLKRTPNLGEFWGVRRGHEIRKVLLPQTKKKLYVTRPKPEVIRILSLWGGQRGREPKL